MECLTLVAERRGKSIFRGLSRPKFLRYPGDGLGLNKPVIELENYDFYY